jgi:hypothetical protein
MMNGGRQHDIDEQWGQRGRQMVGMMKNRERDAT